MSDKLLLLFKSIVKTGASCADQENFLGVGWGGVQLQARQGWIQDFWRGGSNFQTGARYLSFTLFYIYNFPHENEIIWFQRGSSEQSVHVAVYTGIMSTFIKP